MSSTNKSTLITKQQLATRWSCCDRTIDRMLRNGLIKGIDIGGGLGERRTIRFPLVEIREFETSTYVSEPQRS